jgi:hypothetical protein
MNSPKVILFTAALLISIILFSSDASAQSIPLLFQGAACPEGQMLTDGAFIVAGAPGRGDVEHTLGTFQPGVTGIIALHGFYQGQVDPNYIASLTFGQHPLWPSGATSGCCFPEAVPAVIRLTNFFQISPEATLTLRLMKDWFLGACFTDLLTINIGRVNIQHYGLDAIFYVSSDGRLFEDLGLTIPAVTIPAN